MLKPRDEHGSVLVPALLVMVMLLTFVIATAAGIDGDQRDSRRERERESSFQITEGALNAQIYQLSTRWPDNTANNAPYPAACVSGTAGADCPNGPALQQEFASVDYGTGTTWVTQVRDNGGATPNFWTDALLATQPSYDFNRDNFLWVRAEGVVRGRKRTLVALVQAENVTINFPRATLVAGHFETTNNGNKTIIDTNGTSNLVAPGEVIVRCAVATGGSAPGCADWETSKQQVSPNTVRSNPLQPRAVSLEALDLLRDRARAHGNYHASGCGSLEGDVDGETVFIENAEGCSYKGDYNTAAKPGYVIFARGRLGNFNGNATFHGILYHANLDDRSDDLITLGGNVVVYGSIVIDGPGGLSAGSSKENLIYDPNVFNDFKGFGTAGIVQNTFREITPGT